MFHFYIRIHTRSKRSRFIPQLKHLAKRHAEQRRRVSDVISQALVRLH